MIVRLTAVEPFPEDFREPIARIDRQPKRYGLLASLSIPCLMPALGGLAMPSQRRMKV